MVLFDLDIKRQEIPAFTTMELSSLNRKDLAFVYFQFYQLNRHQMATNKGWYEETLDVIAKWRQQEVDMFPTTIHILGLMMTMMTMMKISVCFSRETVECF